MSITGTNGKTTTTRLIAHILREPGKRVGATTSDGIVVDGTMVEPGDWTGPGGARAILKRDDSTSRSSRPRAAGSCFAGVGYESNEASVITNVSSDHMDLQGIHTLPELAEVKGVIARITKPRAGSCSTPTTSTWLGSRESGGRFPAATVPSSTGKISLM